MYLLEDYQCSSYPNKIKSYKASASKCVLFKSVVETSITMHLVKERKYVEN